MSYCNNNKFNYLLDKVFNNFQSKLRFDLESLQQIPILPKDKFKNYKPSRLELDYPIKFFFRKKTNNLVKNGYNVEKIPNNTYQEHKKYIPDHKVAEHTKYIPDQTITEHKKYIPDQTVAEHTKIEPKFTREVNDYESDLQSKESYKSHKLNNKPLQTSILSHPKSEVTPLPVNILQNIISNDIILIELNKVDDFYSIAFYSALSKEFYISSITEKKDLLKNLKLKTIEKFSKENYYRDYDYSTKLFKKSDLDEVFSFNKNISMNMLKVYSDVFNINCVYIYDNNITFLTKFNSSNATVLIEETNNKIYTLMKNDSFIRGNECENYIGVNQKFSKSTLSKFKLDKLQNIARMYNYNTKKQGKVGKVNLSKDELIDIISID